MFLLDWIKRIFTGEVVNDIAAGFEPSVSNAALQAKLDKIEKAEEPAVEVKETEKPAPKKAAPKKAVAKKPAAKKTVKKETKETPDLNSMTKAKLVEWAKTELKVDLDGRKKKDFIIEQIKDHLNKEK